MKILCLPLLCALLSIPSPVSAASKKKPSGRTCSTIYSVVTRDKLGNLTQGASDKELKTIQGKFRKKYPDVCYAPPDPSVKVVFFLTVVPATYHGHKVVTNTANTYGTVSGGNGDYADYDGTTTSSQVVPYSLEYGRYMLTIETLDGSKVTVRHRFQQDGIFRTLYGIPLGGRGHHPKMALIEDALKWVHAGGLQDPLQSSE